MASSDHLRDKTAKNESSASLFMTDSAAWAGKKMGGKK
jgi:hypothetical protein